MKVLSVIAACFIYSAASAQSDAKGIDQKVVFENEKVEITTRVETCDDAHSDLSFEYHMLKVRNKTSEQLNVQFWSHGHEVKSTEFFHSLVIAPDQTLQGACDSEPGNSLKFFRKDKGSSEVQDLNLVEFKVISLQ